ncbi:MvaI/BcnI family restriction endonuclease [Endozoicomonas euniceicola]|uniref:MvaI/BcnI family restriction endonuclease n=1 Tax=Endozoicomonas euniceicola TaxID=1234143 RepID=A0ABY6GNY0_9GAMM|nr:MvaI/BcnI family restriction endonuclease [Endozoicomonas euniceicola]UYM13856.1 MvaI/BcnI family restriction endonuclease [Endozoicomonas euniceicola]
MLTSADIDLSLIAKKLLEKNLQFSFLVPTETALKKSIIDAHDSFRAFLKQQDIHDYKDQQKGTKHKKIVSASILSNGEIAESKISLYRPETKDGDPRLWVYGLSKYASPNNVIAVIYHKNNLFVLNCSEYNNFEKHLNSGLFDTDDHKTISPIANELLAKLRNISSKGFIKTITPGDTGIGMTLESLLEIQANSSREPDYKGIELKSKRTRSRGNRAREQLFSKVPIWKSSPISKAVELIKLRGYIDKDGSEALRHTISADKPNSLGLYLEVDQENDILKQMHYDSETEKSTYDVCWKLSELKQALLKKHKETFWVYARGRGKGANEEFHYIEVTHTQKPAIEKFDILLETGLLTVDYTMHIKENGQVRDHGYLFKIKPEAFSILFPAPILYSLES